MLYYIIFWLYFFRYIIIFWFIHWQFFFALFCFYILIASSRSNLSICSYYYFAHLARSASLWFLLMSDFFVFIFLLCLLYIYIYFFSRRVLLLTASASSKRQCDSAVLAVAVWCARCVRCVSAAAWNQSKLE